MIAKILEFLKKSIWKIIGWFLFLGVLGICCRIIFEAFSKSADMMTEAGIKTSDLVIVFMHVLPAALMLILSFFLAGKFLFGGTSVQKKID